MFARILAGLLSVVANIAVGQQMICDGTVCRQIQPVRNIIRSAGDVIGSIGPEVVIHNDVTFMPVVNQVLSEPITMCQPTVLQSATVCGCGCGRVGCGCGQSMQTHVGYRGGSRYEISLKSAQYRASRGIKGHCSIEMGFTAGVGWSSFDAFPLTCLGRGGSNYAVVRGRDGWYATKIR